MGIFAVTLIVCGASFATAGIPDLEESTASAATGGTLSLFCLPNGGGSVFADAYVKGGSGGATVNANATITLTLRDGGSFIIGDFSREDIWLQWTVETTMIVCVGGTIADADTDPITGQTEWANGLRLGGYAEALVQVRINGDALTSSAGIALHVNSADVNYDGVVNLADVGNFSSDYSNPVVQYRSDFANDGVMNVADVGKMALGVGASCP
jgi:hypothetical protein